MYQIKRLYRPEYFQGSARQLLERDRSGYFEGWYFKVSSDDGAYAFIPGISLAEADPHCFVQVIDSEGSSYHRYPLESFSSPRDRFELNVGPNRFTLDGLHIDLGGLQADLCFSDQVRWPSTPLAPSSMGWYSFMRIMECYHAVIVMDGSVSGSLNGIGAEGKRLYLEKDWGVSFPRAWIWMQTNGFPGGGSVTCSVGVVPFRRRVFTGFIAGLLVDGRLYRFTTYNGTELASVSHDERRVKVRFVRRKAGSTWILELVGSRSPGWELASPTQGAMEGRIIETLTSEVAATLTVDGRVIFDDCGANAGLEVVNPELL